MILLHRCHSETGLFDEVRFGNGINIILGKYSIETDTASRKEINGIGKSTLVRLIDYAFLSKGAQLYFNTAKYEFLNNHKFALEFFVDDYLYTIERNFSERKKVRFGRGNNLIEYEEGELKQILCNKFFTDEEQNICIDNNWFRNLMNFFIKDDIDHHERKDPINFIAPSIRRPLLLAYNLFLLGLPSKSIYDFDILKQEIEKRKILRKEIEKDIKRSTGKTVDELKSGITEIAGRIKTIEKGLKELTFIEKYKDIEDSLVKLSVAISEKLKEIAVLRNKLKSYEESYKIDIEVDSEKIEKLYGEINQALGGFVKQTIENVIDFRRNIAENRKKFIFQRENQTKSSIQELLKNISQLERERSRLYRLLDEKEAFDSIRNTYEQLIDERAKWEKDIFSIGRLQEIEENLAEQEVKKAELIQILVKEVRGYAKDIDNLILLYNEILKNAIFVNEDEQIQNSYFNVSSKVDSRSPLDISIEVPKSQALGKARFKILAYDLMVFLNIIRTERKLPSFLIHDGVFHAIDPKTVINVLNFINRQTLQYPNFQYIITANENEIYVPSEKEASYGKYDFNINDKIVVTYEDVPEQMIFKQEF